MAGKRGLSDAEVDEAVDSLLTSFGLPDDGKSVEETGFDNEDGPPKLKAAPKEAPAPSGEVDALWGAQKPRKK